jgi:site-specific DNA-cytosine methylase
MAKQGTQKDKDPKAGYQLEAVANRLTPDTSDRRSANSKQQGLSNQMETWATPDASARGCRSGELVQGKNVTRRNSGQVRGIDLQTQAQGKLNPRWVETLMGLPIGWVNPEIENLNSAAHYTDVYHRESELRMLGNGVLPATVAKAYKTLTEELENANNKH